MTVSFRSPSRRHAAALLSALFLLCSVPSFGTKRVIPFEQLPPAVQTFVNTHYAGIKVQEVTLERRGSLTQYELNLKGGHALQFSRKGHLTEASCKKGPVPDGVVPAAILQQVRKRYPGQQVSVVNHDYRLWEIDLAPSGIELTFTPSFRLVDIEKPEEEEE